MASRSVLVVVSRDTARDARGVIPLLADEGLQGTIVLGEDGSSSCAYSPLTVVIWAPPVLAYSLFRRWRSHPNASLSRFLLVLPSSKPVTLDVDPGHPNEAYLRGNVGARDVVAAIMRQLAESGAYPPSEPEPHAATSVSLRGRVITVFSAKGGVGKTAISTNLAVAIKDGRSAKVLLMDGDLQFGDAAVWLGLAPRIGIVELLESGGADDETAIRSAVQEHESGVHVLLPPADPAVAELVSPSAIHALIETLRRMYDYVVIDTHTSYEDETLAMLDAADDILLVITPEVSVVRNTQTFLRICDTLGYAHKLIAVLNRANTGIRLDQLPDGIRKLVEVEAVSDGRTVVYSVNMGKPFVQQHKTLAVSQGITTLATFFAGRPNVTCRSGWKKALWPFISRPEKRNGSAEGALSR